MHKSFGSLNDFNDASSRVSFYSEPEPEDQAPAFFRLIGFDCTPSQLLRFMCGFLAALILIVGTTAVFSSFDFPTRLRLCDKHTDCPCSPWTKEATLYAIRTSQLWVPMLFSGGFIFARVLKRPLWIGLMVATFWWWSHFVVDNAAAHISAMIRAPSEFVIYIALGCMLSWSIDALPALLLTLPVTVSLLLLFAWSMALQAIITGLHFKSWVMIFFPLVTSGAQFLAVRIMNLMGYFLVHWDDAEVAQLALWLASFLDGMKIVVLLNIHDSRSTLYFCMNLLLDTFLEVFGRHDMFIKMLRKLLCNSSFCCFFTKPYTLSRFQSILLNQSFLSKWFALSFAVVFSLFDYFAWSGGSSTCEGKPVVHHYSLRWRWWFVAVIVAYDLATNMLCQLVGHFLPQMGEKTTCWGFKVHENRILVLFVSCWGAYSWAMVAYASMAHVFAEVHKHHHS
eukprot:TRINITY_DN94543_c0_g1_i1.p1 TRINITY_DN94543_c0_g1~~TRINITY_DN94543_c0_g1_i1.p1  ORF type:complete len:451 (+),score=5.43 TRINITY_DN94543_c0_g1_i1:45-1397(+)